MKYLILLLMAVTVTACLEKKAITAHKTNNPDVPVSLLFEHDGCSVFRFVDAERFHYYVRCATFGKQQTMYEYNCGKTCIQYESISTHQ